MTTTRAAPSSVGIRAPALSHSALLSHSKMRFIAAASALPQKYPNRVRIRRAWSGPDRFDEVLPELREGVQRMQQQPPAVQVQVAVLEVHHLRKLQFIGSHA